MSTLSKNIDLVASSRPEEAVKNNNNNNPIEVIILLDEQKEKMKQSHELKSILRSKRLVKEIEGIDSAQDRVAQMRRSREANPDFNNFCDLLLNTIKVSK